MNLISLSNSTHNANIEQNFGAALNTELLL
jgi:hypothetical protein